MNNNKSEKHTDEVEMYPEASVNAVDGCPETAIEMINAYGTYNIQPTACTENDFPAIAQGENERSHRFSGDAENDGSESDRFTT